MDTQTNNNLQQNINISSKNISGKCDLKCAYNFKYCESNLIAKNNGVMISLTPDNNNEPPVLFNNDKYDVSNIFITCPSMHTFNGSLVAAEIVIEHTPIIGGGQLNVSIPITLSSENSTATNLITEIIEKMSSNAPKQGDSTNINVTDFTLQNIVPNKPFFSYKDNHNNEWVVFGYLNAIPLNTNTIDILKKIIKPFPIPTKGTELFYNSSGPNTSGTIGDGIYISCKPTGSSEEEMPVEYAKNTTSYDLLHNENMKIIIQIILGCILFVFIFYAFNYIYSWIVSGAPKMPSLPFGS